MTSQVNRNVSTMNSVSDILDQGALPDAPLMMPIQNLERRRSLLPRFNWFGIVGRKTANG